MKKVSFIFDCDGTLVDSYPAIADRHCRALARYGVCYTVEEITNRIVSADSGTFVRQVCRQRGLDCEKVIEDIRNTPENRSLHTLEPHCREMLEALKKIGCECFVYTHRGATTEGVFADLGIKEFFTEIVNSTHGFARKPSGEAVDYLVKKYGLDREHTFYVGDRTLDIECGKNGNIKTVFLKTQGIRIPDPGADFTVSDLRELLTIAQKA